MTTPVNPTNSGSTTGNTASGSSSSVLGGLTMNDFLTLMTAQLQNQDPLNPTDSNEFLSQLSELSTVEGISQLNTSLGTLSNSMLASQAVNSAALVGQTILAPASSGVLASGGTLSGAVQVPSGANSVTLSIANSAGVTVAQVAMPTGAGMQSFSWNGQTSNGGTAPPGTYSVSAAAVVGSTSEAATTYLNGTVSSVTLDPSGSSVLLNTPQLGSVPLSNVQQLD
ncbi:MAG TPA: flagellar hook capping FlgD N-terminal domain-containing protein [Steroidobacteraceae bacterium]|jgi:flagellar basal-body rod modification protein FlgD|nr:flagellar hook capping FlgD N-terminal domain-containing protein [Steroidobacteraceae bacterium]